jgi:hypothetical protein
VGDVISDRSLLAGLARRRSGGSPSWVDELVRCRHRVRKKGAGALIDRTPLLTGGEAVFTPLPFTITSNQVSMSVRASAVGNPTSFLWDIVTVYWAGPPHSVGFHPVDSFDPFFNPWPS